MARASARLCRLTSPKGLKTLIRRQRVWIEDKRKRLETRQGLLGCAFLSPVGIKSCAQASLKGSNLGLSLKAKKRAFWIWETTYF